MKYTYEHYQAHLEFFGNKTCIVPADVGDNQKEFDGKTFPAIYKGQKIRVKLIGDDYGLLSQWHG